MTKVELPTFRCLRCGHTWHPRKPFMPRVCPRCKNPYWKLPPKISKKKKEKRVEDE